jgi:hypothetical protein
LAERVFENGAARRRFLFRYCERQRSIPTGTAKSGLLRPIAPMRKRFALVAGNDVAVISVGTNISIGINGDAS